jgi:hypothetical protein
MGTVFSVAAEIVTRFVFIGAVQQQFLEEQVIDWSEPVDVPTFQKLLKDFPIGMLGVPLHLARPSLKPIGYTWSYTTCRVGHSVPLWQPLIRSSFQQ